MVCKKSDDLCVGTVTSDISLVIVPHLILFPSILGNVSKNSQGHGRIHILSDDLGHKFCTFEIPVVIEGIHQIGKSDLGLMRVDEKVDPSCDKH